MWGKKFKVYDAVVYFFKLVTSIFFREIDVVGLQNIPKEGPVIFVGNHQNQFVDGLLVLTTCKRSAKFLVAAKSMKRALVGFFAKIMNSIPVERRQDVKPKRGVGTITRLVPGPTFYRVDEVGDMCEESDSPMLSWGPATPRFSQAKRDISREIQALEEGDLGVPTSDDEPVQLHGKERPFDILVGRDTQFLKDVHVGDTIQVKSVGRHAQRRKSDSEDHVAEITGLKKGGKRVSVDAEDQASVLKEKKKEEDTWITFRVSKVVSDTVVCIDRDGVAAGGRQVRGAYQTTKKVDYTTMFSEVYKTFENGDAIVIFPEGGSHDRPELLPLKAGVAQMALGALEKNGKAPTIIPCGLNYFKGHKFRSQVVVEFGPPVKMNEEWETQWTEGGREGQKMATASLLSAILSALQGVTLQAHSFEQLKFLYLARRLYMGNSPTVARSSSLAELFSATSSDGAKVPDLLKVSHMIKDIFDRESENAEKGQNSDSKFLTLLSRVSEYGDQLKQNYLKDKDLVTAEGDSGEEKEKLDSWFYFLGVFVLRVVYVMVLFLLGLPGTILNIFTIVLTKLLAIHEMKKAKASSSVKIKGKDVIASYKILVAMVVVPINYFCQIMFMFYFYGWIGAVLIFFLNPALSYASIKIGEEGIGTLHKSVIPTFFALLPGGTKKRQELRQKRRELRDEVQLAVKERLQTMGSEFWERYQTVVNPANIHT